MTSSTPKAPAGAHPTQEEFDRAVTQLKESNRRVSVNSVIGLTGGSRDLVHARMKQRAAIQAASELPQPVPEAVLAAVKQALTDTDARARASSENQLEDALQDIEQLQALLVQKDSEIEVLQSRAEEARLARLVAESLHAKEVSKHDATQQELEEVKDQLKAVEIREGKLQGTLEIMQQLVATHEGNYQRLLQLRAGLADASQQRSEASEATSQPAPPEQARAA